MTLPDAKTLRRRAIIVGQNMESERNEERSPV